MLPGLHYMVDELPHGFGRGVVAGVIMITLAGVVACSTTDEDPSGPWEESLMNEICDESTRGTSDCNR